jgi:hypothetical protein
MKLIITIDTEEDNWGCYQEKAITLENIYRISDLQQLFDEFKVIPTYLVTYPVANDKKSASLLKSILDKNRCEIGTHCHPWNTPPFEENICERNSMLSNLPYELQRKKILKLHEIISSVFGISPICFRAGRWGYNEDTAEVLLDLGYKIDTSVTAFTDWSQYLGPDFSDFSVQPFYYRSKKTSRGPSANQLLEVPATVGFAQKRYLLCNKILKQVRKIPFKYLRIYGLLDHLKMVNKIMLSPETSDGNSMIQLCKSMMINNYPILNMFFHSTSLMEGLSPFVKTKADVARFHTKIRDVLTFCRDVGIESIKLSDAATIV